MLSLTYNTPGKQLKHNHKIKFIEQESKSKKWKIAA